MSWSIVAMMALAFAGPGIEAADASRLGELVRGIRSADYRGEREELRRLAARLDEVKDPRLAAYREYWRGFARWRRALNGFNETPSPADIPEDLESAIRSFRAALGYQPEWIEAKVGVAGCSASLLYLAGNDAKRREALLTEFLPAPLLQADRARGRRPPRFPESPAGPVAGTRSDPRKAVKPQAVRLAARYRLRSRKKSKPWTQSGRKRGQMMAQLIADARFAVRGIWKRPGLTLLVVATLAVGLAANAAIFSVLNALFLRPLPFPNLPRLVRLWETAPGADVYDRDNVAPGNFRDWESQSAGVLERVVALEYWNANLRGRDVVDRVQGYRVSPRFFETLGVSTAAGRGFLLEEGQPGSDRRVVLAHDLWQRVFGADPGIVGRSVMVDGEAHVVVGIAPRGFRFPEGAEIWAPLVLPPPGTEDRDRHYLSAIGSLAAGRRFEDAVNVMALAAQRLQKDHPETNASRSVAVERLQKAYEDPGDRPLLALWQAAAGLVLLMACVNVANLMLARGAERRRELALRLALGAGRGQIIRQLLTEGLVTSLLAVAASLPLSVWSARELRGHMPAEIARFLPGWDDIRVDGWTFAFSLGLGVLATLLFTLVPALRASRPGLVDALKEGGRSTTAGAGRQRGRNVLVVAQVAGALVLVVLAGMTVRSAHRFLSGPQGYDPDHLLTLRITLPQGRYPEPESRRAFARSADERLSAIPGVTAAAFANVLPGRAGGGSRPIQIEGEPAADRSNPPVVDTRTVSPGYFETLRVPILSGRALMASDDEKALPVAVVSRSLAARYWPGRDAIGRRFRLGDDKAEWITVVGISGDVIHHWAARRNYPTCYVPYAQDPRADLGFALRTAGDPEAMGTAARLAIAAVDPYQPAYDVWSMRRSISISTIGLQYVAAIMAVFGGLALVLAMSGVYGVMSYRVSLRTLEFGVRVALGASTGDVLQLTMAQALRLTAAGLLLGGAIGFAAARALSAILMGLISLDAPTFAGATGFLAATALLAAYVPARRALTVDPARALRSE
jgi:putative ABC transport system permease protein